MAASRWIYAHIPNREPGRLFSRYVRNGVFFLRMVAGDAVASLRRGKDRPTDGPTAPDPG